MNFGDRLVELRKEKGISGAKLARLFEIAPSSIGMYEQGRRTPNYKLMIKLANFFNVSLDYITGKSDIRDKKIKLNSDNLKINLKEFGEKIKIRRNELELSQEELAEKMGYSSKTSIHKLEVGEYEIPLSKLQNLADILNVSVSYLLGIETNIAIKEENNNKYSDVINFLDKMTEENFEIFKKLIFSLGKLDNERLNAIIILTK